MTRKKLNNNGFGSLSIQGAPLDKQFIKKVKEGRFLVKILPTKGYFCVAEMEILPDMTKNLHHHWFDCRAECIDFIQSFNNINTQIYLAQASFSDKGAEWNGRTQKNAAYLCNVYMDIDCGPDKPYASQKEGKKALDEFCKVTGLNNPAIVISGNGLYAHWPFVDEIHEYKWKLIAEKMKKLVKAIEPGLDKDGVITDSARILRPIGSVHRKNKNEPKNVRLFRDCEPIEFNIFMKSIDNAIAGLPDKSVSTQNKPANSDNSTISRKTFSAIKIAEKCAVISHLKETKGNVPEPLWHACIGLLKHCVESPNIIHEWSIGHTNYSKNETNDKIDRCSKRPTKCERFAELSPDLCCKCNFKGNFNSPIALGMPFNGVETPGFIVELNMTYFVSRNGGKTVVCREAYDNELKRRKLEMSSFSDFRNFFVNQKIDIGTNRDGTSKVIPLGKAWLEHNDRRQYDEIVMSPEGDIDGAYNLWHGFAVEPCKGEWNLLKDHIRHVICKSDKMTFRYVLRWLARMIQQPWKPGEVALVLQGNKGIGKGFFVNSICKLLDQHSLQIFNARHLTGNFNSHLEDCILLYVDEAFWAGDKGGESVLKGLITEPTIPIERKGFDLKSVRNMLHIIMASNNDWVVPASMDERRYCVLKVSDHHYEDFNYFAALEHEINNGGLEAMLYDLKNLDISDFNVRKAPKTEGLVEQKLQSLDTVQAWWYQKLQDGVLLPEFAWGPVPCRSLFDDYVASTQKLGGNTRRSNETMLGKQLIKILPKGWPKKRRPSVRGTSDRVMHYDFPNLNDCRKHFEKLVGVRSLEW